MDNLTRALYAGPLRPSGMLKRRLPLHRPEHITTHITTPAALISVDSRSSVLIRGKLPAWLF
jgi:hypothetical protein